MTVIRIRDGHVHADTCPLARGVRLTCSPSTLSDLTRIGGTVHACVTECPSHAPRPFQDVQCDGPAWHRGPHANQSHRIVWNGVA